MCCWLVEYEGGGDWALVGVIALDAVALFGVAGCELTPPIKNFNCGSNKIADMATYPKHGLSRDY